MKTTLQAILFQLLYFFVSCNIVNPKEDIPTYIHIDSVRLSPTVPAVHGSVSHKITDVWVYYERELLGAYQLPARVPVLAKNKGQLQVIGGIWDNGLSGTRAKYPFFIVDTFTFNAKPTDTIQHIPVFTYRTTDTPSIKYFIEGFEQGNSFIKKGGDTTFAKTNNLADKFEGDWSSIVELNDTIKSFESITTQNYVAPPNRECYMELNYKSDIPLLIRIELLFQGAYIKSDVIGLNAKDKWSKIYINLKGFTTTYQNASFNIIIKGSLPADKLSSKTLIDNFKIIYYN